jgi:hypothetical protein
MRNDCKEYDAIRMLKGAGCKCVKPMLGYVGHTDEVKSPRCKLCNTVAESLSLSK